MGEGTGGWHMNVYEKIDSWAKGGGVACGSWIGGGLFTKLILDIWREKGLFKRKKIFESLQID